MYNRKHSRRHTVHLLSLVIFQALFILLVASCQKMDSYNRDVKLIVNYLDEGPSLRDLLIIEKSITSVNNATISAAYEGALEKYPLAFQRFKGLSAESLAGEYSPALSLEDALSVVELGLPDACIKLTTMSLKEIKDLYGYLLSTEWRFSDDTQYLSYNALALVAEVIIYLEKLGYIELITDLNFVIDMGYYDRHKDDLRGYYWMVYFLSAVEDGVNDNDVNILPSLLKEEINDPIGVMSGISDSIVYIKAKDHNFAEALCKTLYGYISAGNDIDYTSYLLAIDIFNAVDGEYVVKTMSVLPDPYFVPFVKDRANIVSKYFSQFPDAIHSDVVNALDSFILAGNDSIVNNINPDVLREMGVSVESVIANSKDPIQYLRFELSESEMSAFTRQPNDRTLRWELFRAFCRLLLNAKKSGSKID